MNGFGSLKTEDIRSMVKLVSVMIFDTVWYWCHHLNWFVQFEIWVLKQT